MIFVPQFLLGVLKKIRISLQMLPIKLHRVTKSRQTQLRLSDVVESWGKTCVN